MNQVLHLYNVPKMAHNKRRQVRTLNLLNPDP